MTGGPAQAVVSEWLPASQVELEFLPGATDHRLVSRFRGLTADEHGRLSRRLAEPSRRDARPGRLADDLPGREEPCASWRAGQRMAGRQNATTSGSGMSAGAPRPYRGVPMRYYPPLWELRDRLQVR